MILENESIPDDTRVYLEAIALVEHGYRVTVICPTGKRRKAYEMVDGIQVYRYPHAPQLRFPGIRFRIRLQPGHREHTVVLGSGETGVRWHPCSLPT